jgi:hypothetical protein
MHLSGTATLGAASDYPAVAGPATDPTDLGECRLLHLVFETSMNTSLLPPAVHPSIPYHVSIVAWEAPGGPLGDLRLVQVRLGCIVDILPRGFVTAALTDNADFARLLRDKYGMPARVAATSLVDDGGRRRLTVRSDGQVLIDVAMERPAAVPGGSTSVFSSISLANVEGDLRLVQSDFRMALVEPQRGSAVAETFEAEALGAPGVGLQWPVSAIATSGTITLRPVRYILDPATPPTVTAEDLHQRNSKS